MAGRNTRWGRGAERRRMSRPVGCLVWLIVLIAALIVASLLFGGFQKGTKASGEPRLNSQQVTVFAAGHSDGALAWPCA
jgi:hypothetical protein